MDVDKIVAQQMAVIGEKVAAAMREKLKAAGHIDSGALYDSIHQETEIDGNQVVTTVYANAESEDGTQYAEFIEHGSGIYRAGGRTTPWRYKDRHGNWHTTHGMAADPFMEPAVEEVFTDEEIDNLVEEIVYNIDLYGKGKTK